MVERKSGGPLRLLGPGLLVAATGVGAGDLATAAFTGSRLGTSVLWAVLLGGIFKIALTDGLTRYQLSTGQSVLRGAVRRFGKWPLALFLALYVVPFGWFVGVALVSACGVAANSLLPIFGTSGSGVAIFGAAHALLGLLLVRLGSFRWFERIMSVLVFAMFSAVILTAAFVAPPLEELLAGLVPRVPKDAVSVSWIVALVGGVGGTLTILCYGDWIREHGRTRPADLRTCRIDIAVGYGVTCLFGMAMVVLGAGIEVEGSGTGLLVALGENLETRLGPAARITFLVGAWAAIFSSLLGVWEAVPRIFDDLWRGLFELPKERGRAFDLYQLGLALLPASALLLGLSGSGGFKAAQKSYAVLGALFLPLLALALLILEREPGPAGTGSPSSRRAGRLALLATLGFFAYSAWHSWMK